MDEGTATPEAMMDETMAPDEGEMMGDESMAMPGFFAVALKDAASGSSFTFGDFKGKVVLLEPFAQWCPTCLRQQQQVARLHTLLGEGDDLISVGLDIDPNEDEAMLQQYLAVHGFDWRYAVAPQEVASEIGELYGSQYLNPPSAPMLLIDRHGEVHPLPSGVKSAEQLLEIVEPFLAGSM
jgi:cytochrome oxidase Cu insertion factor (SCO1/SenC/PrrC family)